jgi:hypothetical protein
MCSVVRKLVAHEPVDWVATRPKPIKLPKPDPPSRKFGEHSLKPVLSEPDSIGVASAAAIAFRTHRSDS